jgi:predicted CopG family antitoxin
MRSLLNTKKTAKSFEEKLGKLSQKTRENINAAKNYFDKFSSFNLLNTRHIFEFISIFEYPIFAMFQKNT